ncbi:MAG: filamentous hemagglutinin N-terminal domain-containing protein, partial [Verrucomicrobiota bacterium]
MSNVLNNLTRRALVVSSALFGWRLYEQLATANPIGGTVVSGSATIKSSGSQETITTAGNAYINWNTFNIGGSETTTFVEPSATSVVWNNITGSGASQILGTINANGYVILQNQAGFYVGGTINAHGLIMTTAASPAPNLSSGGAWEFDAPPPTAKIINCGKINIADGGSAFLIAADIENNGTITAPSGNIGLYAGEKVLISTTPNGLGLSAEVTLPQGSVDNKGNLIADGGTIAAQAQTVNQNGLVQANSVQEVNGTIELVASDAVSLGANSAISAQGGSTGASSGGSVTIQAGNTFSDQAGS